MTVLIVLGQFTANADGMVVSVLIDVHLVAANEGRRAQTALTEQCRFCGSALAALAYMACLAKEGWEYVFWDEGELRKP